MNLKRFVRTTFGAIICALFIAPHADAQVTLNTTTTSFTPFDVAWDPVDGELFVPDVPGTGTCLVFDGTLNQISSFTMQFGDVEVRGIASEPSGTLLWLINASGQASIVRSQRDGSSPITVAVLPGINGADTLGIDLSDDGTMLFLNGFQFTASSPMATLGSLTGVNLCIDPNPLRTGIAWLIGEVVSTIGLEPLSGFFNSIERTDLTNCAPAGGPVTVPQQISFGIDLQDSNQFGNTFFVTDLATSTVNRVLMAQSFVRGDVDGDQLVTMADANALIAFINAPFTTTLPCLDAADFDDDGIVFFGDVIQLLAFLNGTGGPPLPPFPACGTDPSLDTLGCLTSTCP